MTENYNAELQHVATEVWKLRTEYERVSEEFRTARARRDQLAEQIRTAETHLSKSVGSNIRSRMWIVRTGTAVLAHYLNESITLIHVFEAEPQE